MKIFPAKFFNLWWWVLEILDHKNQTSVKKKIDQKKVGNKIVFTVFFVFTFFFSSFLVVFFSPGLLWPFSLWGIMWSWKKYHHAQAADNFGPPNGQFNYKMQLQVGSFITLLGLKWKDHISLTSNSHDFDKINK